LKLVTASNVTASAKCNQYLQQNLVSIFDTALMQERMKATRRCPTQMPCYNMVQLTDPVPGLKAVPAAGWSESGMTWFRVQGGVICHHVCWGLKKTAGVVLWMWVQ